MFGRGIASGETDTAVLSYRVWRNMFARDPKILGRKLILDGRNYTVVGVLPADHRSVAGFGISPDVLIPVTNADESAQFYARMPKDMTIAVARARLRAVFEQLDHIHPKDGWKRTDNVRVTGVTGFDMLHQGLPGAVTAFFAMLMIVVGLVLLIACANVAGLLLARASSRSHELAIRLSLGASRRRIVPPVVVVNETFAHTVFGDTDPVGHTIRSDFKGDKMKRIVGVVKDSKYFTLSEKQRLAVYEPYFAYEEPVNLHFLIRVAGSPAVYVKPITDVLGRLDSTAAVETKPMGQALGLALLPSQAAAVMLGAIGILALVLAAIGLYGVLLYSVSRRTREIGLRVALGATTSDVLRMISRHSLVLVGSGTLAGLALALLTMKPLALFLVPGLSAHDPAALGAVIGVLGAVALLASLAPATRALHVDPMSALRYE